MEKYCVLRQNEVLDLKTGLAVSGPLSKLNLRNSKLFFFDKKACEYLIRNNSEINDLPELERLKATRSISQINLVFLQVSTEYRNLDEAIEELKFSRNDYSPLIQWINHQISLKQKYLNLLFYRTDYWNKVLNNETVNIEPWSDQMLAITSYSLIDQIYNQPFPVENVQQTTFRYLDHIPLYLQEYFEQVFIDKNFDEPEICLEYRRFIHEPIRISEIIEFKKFNFFNMEIRLTYGGLHYNADDYFERPIKLIDFKAYYPNLMITFNLQSRRIVIPEQREYLKQWLKIRNDLSDPNKQQKIPADFKEIKDKFKIFQSSLYGCLRDTGSKRKSNLYDPLTGLVLTFTGQWVMLAFIKQLKPFIKCIYGINTDGLFLEWKNEREDGQRIQKVVDDFYNMTKIRYTYDSFNKCFFFRFNQLLCIKNKVLDSDGNLISDGKIYAKGDFFKNYEKTYDDEYYITQGLVNFYAKQIPINLDEYPLVYFSKTLSLKYNPYKKKTFLAYESHTSKISLEELEERNPELLFQLKKISSKFLFQEIEYHKMIKPNPLANRDLISVIPAVQSERSFMVRIYDEAKANSYDSNNHYFYYDRENKLKILFEYHEFDENPDKIGWDYRIKYLNAKIVNGADYYVLTQDAKREDLDLNFCYRRIRNVMQKLPTASYDKKYPELKKEIS